jgi:hypothetical protein
MAKKAARPAHREGGLHLAIENQDWVAITGTSAELEQLGRLLIEFAQTDERAFAILDSPSPLFRSGSLGITLYRKPEPAAAPEPGLEPEGG